MKYQHVAKIGDEWVGPQAKRVRGQRNRTGGRLGRMDVTDGLLLQGV